MSTQSNIAIFQVDHPLQVHTLNCAILLAKEGYAIDLFLHRTPMYADLELLSSYPEIRVHLLSHEEKIQCFQEEAHSFNWRTYYHAARLWLKKFLFPIYAALKITRDLFFLRILLPRKAFRKMRNKQYACFIGIEKQGLIWAGLLAGRTRTPYLYYSLELYTWEHPYIQQSFMMKIVKLLEKTFHQRSCATIVQDAMRGGILLADNKVEQTRLLYVPVSLMKPIYTKHSTFFQEKFDLHEEQFIILQFGHISEDRFTLELTEIAQDFPENWRLLLHGCCGFQSVVAKIQARNNRQRVILSLDRLPDSMLQPMAASAKAGLVLYPPEPINDRLTSRSSEKLALYLQCGVPVVAFNYPGYELLEEYGCGVLIRELHELPQAIERIQADHEAFSRNAYRCFMDHYELSRNFQKVIRFINELETV